jgi:hypothetical protein
MITSTTAKLLKLTFLALLFFISVNAQELFKGGPYTKGQQVKDAYGTVWQARQNIANAVTPPSANTYWSYVKTVPVITIDSLLKRIGILESSYKPVDTIVYIPPVDTVNVPVWYKAGAEHDIITVPSNTNLRYGAIGGPYLTKTFSGTFQAENQFFGGDPAPGQAKYVFSDKQTVTPPTIPEPTPTTGTISGTDIIIPTYTPPITFTEVNVATRYGIKAGDNTSALLQLNSEWRWKAPMPYPNAVRFTFPAVTITYTNNGWLNGIAAFEIIASGTNFQCLSTSADDMAKCPLNNGGLLIDYDGRSAGANGQKFKTAQKGSNQITLIEAGSYVAGDRVFICGYEEQFYGYPPNPRFFEWNKVKSVSGSVITLENTLKWSYNELWRDVAGMMPYSIDTYFGKPRIFKLGAGYTQYARFVGPTNWIRNPNTRNVVGVTSAFRFIAENLFCDEQASEDFWASENYHAVYYKCKSEIFEVDKCNGIVELTECYVDGPRSAVTGATGADVLVLKNNTFKNYSGVSPRVLYAEGNTFESKTGDPGLYPHPEMTWVEKVYLKNNTFKGGDPSYTSTMYKWTAGSFTSLAATSNSITFAGTNTQAAKQMGPGPIQSTDGATALLKDIIWDGSNFVTQLENVTGTLKAGQVWMFNREQKVIDLGGNVDLGGKKIY